jgi:hypothetical protein
MELKNDNKLRVINLGNDPTVFRGNEKVAFFLREPDGGYLIGICFPLKDYTPVFMGNLHSAIYKIKSLLELAGIDCSI